MISENTYRKFVETFDVDDWQVETDNGWDDIIEIGKTVEYKEWLVKTDDSFELVCADTHILFRDDYSEVYVKDLKIGDSILTRNGSSKITNVFESNSSSNMYDLSLSSHSNRRFFTNGILSHNSMWMQNIASKLADAGYTVVYVTLEMAKHKCMKRMGAMRLKIDINEYDTLSRDSSFMKNKINELKTMSSGTKLFDSGKSGKIYVRKYPTSDCTVTDLENFVKKFEEQRKLKIDVMVIDYINIMSIEKGYNLDTNLYLKGKHLAEGLRRLADRFNLAVITATQVDKSVWGANDINLGDIPESKAIAESADSIWAIIRNPEMKKQNVYRLKILKLRDGEHQGDQVKFDFNTRFLTIDNDVLFSNNS